MHRHALATHLAGKVCGVQLLSGDGLPHGALDVGLVICIYSPKRHCLGLGHLLTKPLNRLTENP